MNIVINAVLAFDKPRGVGRYINNLLPALANIDKKNEYYIYYGKWMGEYDFLKIKQDNLHFISMDIANTQIKRNLYLAINLPLMCKKHKPDLYFLIDTQATLFAPTKTISVIHDLAEYQVPEKYSAKQRFLRKLIVKHQVRLSDKVITVSEYSKKDICKRFNINDKDVKVIYNALSNLSTAEVTDDPEKYFLFVSEIEKAKNLGVLIEAFALLPENYKKEYMLRVVGKKGNDYENMIQLIEEKKLKDRIKIYGYVDDDALKKFYSKAYCFVFPSLFEGFGLPVLEAMGNGVPVICSNASSIPEVGGDAVLTFNPRNAEELKDCMVRLIESGSLRKEMINRGIERAKMFTTDRAAKETYDMFMEK